MTIRRSRHMTITCTNCGCAAAEVSLVPASGKRGELWHDRDRLERTEFRTRMIKFALHHKLLDLFEAMQYSNWDTAYQLDDEFVSFVCRICEVPYCEECWQIMPPTDDDEENHTWAMCPHEHVQIIDQG